MYKVLRISDFMHRKRIHQPLEPDAEYSLVTIKVRHRGVTLREKKLGGLIKSKMYRVSAGDFILSGIDARNGAFGIIPPSLEGAIVTNDFWYFDIDETVIKRDFFYWLTTTPLFLDACIKSSRGETQRIRLQKDLFFNFEFKLPSIEEQEAFLEQIKIADELGKNFKDEIDTQSTYLTKLRQAILQEAIEGKLTADWRAQHPVQFGDPAFDASALLAQIQAEKEQLIADKKIRKQKPLPPIEADEMPFDVPEGWVWCRLGEVITYTEAGKSHLCGIAEATGSEWGVVKTSAMTSGNFIESENKFFSKGIPDDISKKINIGDLIFCRASGSKGLAGKCCIVETLSRNLLLSDKSIRVFMAGNISPYLIWLHNQSSAGSKYFKSLSTQKSTSMNNVTRGELLNMPFPLPPLAEQQAIVERVDRLLALVDGLEVQVAERKSQADGLMQAVLREAFGGG